ncbi:MAG: DUF305 domain-containing protein [Anaerolineales bacterium]
MHHHPYRRLLIMAALSLAAMYILMYAMVNALSNVYHNINQFYMAGLMTAAMVVIEVAVMSAMYPNRRLNALIIAASLIALPAFLMLIQRQAAVGDRQFLRSMIPHHAAALLMCDQASLQDPEIKDLCERITAGQQAEIDEMVAKLRDLER